MAQYQLVHFNLNGKDVERMVDVRATSLPFRLKWTN